MSTSMVDAGRPSSSPVARATDSQLDVLRQHVQVYQRSAVPSVRGLADGIVDLLSASARRVMPSPAVVLVVESMLSEFASSDAPVAVAGRALLAEVAAYSVSEAELRVLRRYDLFLHFPELARAISAGVSCIIDGVPLSEAYRAELDAYASSECDSVALAVVSLLRAVDAREVRP